MSADEMIALTRGVPAPETFPVEQLVMCAQDALRLEGKDILQYGGAAGYLPLRQWIAEEMQVNIERVVMGQGSLQLLDHTLRVLVKPGDCLFVEQPTYDRTLTLMHRMGAVIKAFDLEVGGINIEHVESELLRGTRPLLFYLIPDFQNPTGNVITLEKRNRLLELAEKYGFLVVEDAPYRKLRYEGQELPSLFELNQDRVLQLSSYSKLISPGLRVGYAILPSELSAPLTKFAEDTYINIPHLNQAMVFQFIQKGWLDEHLTNLKRIYAARLNSLLSGLEKSFIDRATWNCTEGGFFVGLNVNHSPGMDALISSAKRLGILLTDGRGFFVSGGEDFIRLPFCALTNDQITTGLERLKQLI